MFSDKYSKIIKGRKWELLFLAIIIATGVFLRSYNFSKWLHFEIDQAYDFNIVSPAVENGIENLPLLGPTAGGGRALRLGPAFYYIEYISAKIFGNTPTGHAMTVLLLNIAALPLFYLLCRRYFSKAVSLSLLLFFSLSFYSVLYSRFSWSPNVLPFLIILSLYSLLKSTSVDEHYKNRWFLVATFTIAIATQIHFNAFFVLSAITVSYLLIKRPRFTLKTWLVAVGIVLIIYSPVIANDIKTRGENFFLFKNKLLKTSTGKAEFATKTILQDAQHNALGYFFIVTSIGEISSRTINEFALLKTDIPINQVAINFSALLFFVVSIMLLIKNFFFEKDTDKKSFLLLIFLWFFLSFFYFFSLLMSYRLYPRFFLLISPLAIIFFGFILSTISAKKTAFRNALMILIILLVSIFNISRSYLHFRQLAQGEKAALPELETEDVLPNTARITQAQQQAISSYIASIARQNGYVTYISAKDEYEPSFWYFLQQNRLDYFDTMSDSRLYKEANYFIIQPSDRRLRTDLSILNPIETRKFGSLTVYYLKADPSATTIIRPSEAERKISEENFNISQLMTWHKLFSSK